jgi:hypothetical protein
VGVFSTLLTTLKSQAVMVNIKDILITLNLLIQLTPSNLWGEPMHTSGLFAHILTTLIDGEVFTLLMCSEVGLIIRIDLNPFANRAYIPPCADCDGRCADVPAVDVRYCVIA